MLGGYPADGTRGEYRTEAGYLLGSDRLSDHGRKEKGDGIVPEIMTGQLTIIIIIGRSAVIPAIVHSHKCEKTDLAVLAVMLEIMRQKLWQAEQLAHFGIPREVNTHQQYDQPLSQFFQIFKNGAMC